MVDELLQQLQGAPMQQMAQSLGESEEQTQQAVHAAIPMMLGALGNNAQSADGADALFGALQSHGGSPDLGGLLGSLLGGGAGGGQAAGGLGGLGGLGGMLGSVLGGAMGGGAPAGAQSSGAGDILGHIFGGQQDQASSNLGQATGLGGGNAANLLKMLAPLVMSFLAQRVMAGGMNSSDLGNVLGQEKAQVLQQGGLGGGLLGSLLDQNGDGKLDVGDLMKIGGSLLSGRR